MTKRSAEQTLRDEVARDAKALATATDRERSAAEHLADAKALLDASEDLVRSAVAKLERSTRSLEVLLGVEWIADYSDGSAVGNPEETAPESDDVFATPLDGETYDPEENRIRTIAAASGTDVEVVRAASKR